jgi:uncharacterized protein (DUF302 family)
MITYGFTKEVDAPFEKILETIPDALKKEGFGILTRIDLQEKFKEKLGIEFMKYVILGVCHPPSAHKSILVEENIGLMLPCSIIVYEKGGKTAVSIIKPTNAMSMIGNKELTRIAEDVEAKLKRVFESIK